MFVALADTIEKRDLPHPPFEDLLSAFRTDMEVRRYATFSSLRGYTARSADPVGPAAAGAVRLPRSRAGALRRRDLHRPAADQLLAGRGRRRRPRPHLPARRGPALLRRDRGRDQGAEADQGRSGICCATRWRAPGPSTSAAARCCGRLGNDLKLELALIWLIGTTILDKIEAADFDVFTRRPEITTRDKAKVLAKAAKYWATSLDLPALRRLWP